MTKFKLGKRVRGGPGLRRCRVALGLSSRMTWQVSGTTLVEGLYAGSRSYQQGNVEWEDDQNIFIESSPRIRVALILVHPRHNPVPVLYDSLEYMPDLALMIHAEQQGEIKVLQGEIKALRDSLEAM